MIQLHDYQDEAVRKALAELAARQATLVVMPTGTGKAQPLSARISTPNGWTTMGQLRIGDHITDSWGGSTEVTGIFEKGVLPIFRVIFSDGSSCECCGDHLWYVRDRRAQVNKVRVARQWSILTTDQIRESLFFRDGRPRWSIPMVGAIQFDDCGPKKDVDPYLLGVLLGDGCFRSNEVRLSNPEPEIQESVRSRLVPLGLRLVGNEDNLDFYIRPEEHRSSSHPLKRFLEDRGLMGKLSTEKFIPDDYLFAPVADRIFLLQGLLDTDGYTDGHNVEYSTSSSQLAEGMRFLVESLGGTVTVLTRIPDYTHRGEKRSGALSYRIFVKLPVGIPPFRLTRKREGYIPRSKYQPRRTVIAVVPSGEAECRCISVESPNQLYVTDRFIVTHNTIVGAAVAREVVDRGEQVLILCHREELIEQWQRACMALGLTWAVEQQEHRALKPTMFGRTQVVIGSKDTMQGRRLEAWPPHTFSLIIADECHRGIMPTWVKVFAHFHGARRLGLTATPERSDDATVQELFGNCAYELRFWVAIDRGYIVPPLFWRPEVRIDLGLLRSTAQDLNQGDLEDAISGHVDELVNAARVHLDGRPIMTFTPRVFSARAMADGFRQVDISSCSLHGDSEDRGEVVRLFRDLEYRNLCSCDLFREGADFPAVANLVLARPTKSGLVYRQMLGRGLRKDGDKVACNVIDYAWNSGRHNLFRPIDLFDATDCDLDVLKIAAGIVDGGQPDPRKALAEADRIHAREVALKVMVRERMPSYRMMAYDPFQVGSLLGIPNRQRDGMKPLTATNRAKLGHYKLEVAGIADAQARRLIRELEERKRKKLATHRQVACLVAKGVPQDQARALSFDAARDDLDILIGGRT